MKIVQYDNVTIGASALTQADWLFFSCSFGPMEWRQILSDSALLDFLHNRAYVI